MPQATLSRRALNILFVPAAASASPDLTSSSPALLGSVGVPLLVLVLVLGCGMGTGRGTSRTYVVQYACIDKRNGRDLFCAHFGHVDELKRVPESNTGVRRWSCLPQKSGPPEISEFIVLEAEIRQSTSCHVMSMSHQLIKCREEVGEGGWSRQGCHRLLEEIARASLGLDAADFAESGKVDVEISYYYVHPRTIEVLGWNCTEGSQKTHSSRVFLTVR